MLAMQRWNRNRVYSSVILRLLTLVTLRWRQRHIVNQPSQILEILHSVCTKCVTRVYYSTSEMYEVLILSW